MSRIEPEVDFRLIRRPSGSSGFSTYPIGVVSRRTGLPQATLRAWERRYSAIQPLRTPNGRRLYTDADIEKLLLLRQAQTGGWRIGQIADLDAERLRDLVAEVPAVEKSRAAEEGESGDRIVLLRREFLDSARRLDSDAMSRALETASLELSRSRLFDQFLGPLLHEIGDQWADGQLRPAHEHLATATVRHWIEGLRPSLGPAHPASHLLVATPRGQQHELGALLVALCAEEVGWRVTYLGPDLPAEEIALATRELSVDAIALSMLFPAPQLESEIARLRELVGAEIPVFLGGLSARKYARAMENLGIEFRADLSDFRAELRRLSMSLALPGNG